MSRIVVAGSRGRDFLVVRCPGVDRKIPVVTHCLDDPAAFLDFGLSFRVAEEFSADRAGPVGCVAGLFAGRILRLGLYKIMGRILEIDLNDHVIVAHHEVHTVQHTLPFRSVISILLPEFHTVQFIMCSCRSHDFDRHQSGRGKCRLVVSVPDHIGIAAALCDLDVHFMVFLDIEVSAERLPVRITVSCRSEVDRHSAGMIRIHRIVVGLSVVIMLRARIPSLDDSAGRIGHFDLCAD